VHDHRGCATDHVEIARLRVELDGLVIRLYGLTQAEVTRFLDTFSPVSDEAKQAAFAVYRSPPRDP
jgi:hypothetical protein